MTFFSSSSHERKANANKLSFLSMPMPSISTSNSSWTDPDATPTASQRTPSLLRKTLHAKQSECSHSRNTEPVTSDSETSISNKFKSLTTSGEYTSSSTDDETRQVGMTVAAQAAEALKSQGSHCSSSQSSFHKIGFAVARSQSLRKREPLRKTASLRKTTSLKKTTSMSSTRSNLSSAIANSRRNRSSSFILLKNSSRNSKKMKFRKSSKKTPAEDSDDTTDLRSRIQLGSDMLVLADGMHLDSNTKTLLASYDARTVEDFFCMGEQDFKELIDRGRNTNRRLPPLQIRKVRILREWLTDLVEASNTDATGLPWFKPKDINDAKKNQSSSILPRDWKRRFKNDLPMLKKKLRQKGDSFLESIPILSYFFGWRDSLCGNKI